MECHGELGAETGQHPWNAMDSALWILDILMEYHEKSVWKVSLMEYHEKSVLWESSHQRSFVGTSVNLWRICIQRMRPTVDVNLTL